MMTITNYNYKLQLQITITIYKLQNLINNNIVKLSHEVYPESRIKLLSSFPQF